MIHDEFFKLKEERPHGNFLLPYVWYHTLIPKYFVSFPVHWHDEFEIIYIKKGIMNISIDLHNSVVKSGDIVLIKPKSLHGFSQYKEESVDTITMIFSLSMLNAQITDACSMKYFSPMLDGKLEFPSIIHPDDNGYQQLHHCLMEMHQTYFANEKFFELKIKSDLFSFFYHLLNDFCTTYTSSPLADSETQTIKTLIDYIETNYMYQITIADLAETAGLSEHYLMRYFKKTMGLTCIEYINEYRLNIATHLLTETDYPIGIIAEKCGISNVSYFNRLFKKAFHVTPKVYRHNKQISPPQYTKKGDSD